LGIVEVLASPSTVPDLTITKTHSGSFVQGQTARAYAITVTNSGGGATSGAVTLTDTLPAALTAAAIGGIEWTCNAPPSLTCTRSDILPASASYSPIIVTVDVANNAPRIARKISSIYALIERQTQESRRTNMVCRGVLLMLERTRPSSAT
jgi:uncharacterized repeat protein (TIGR01451 family)